MWSLAHQLRHQQFLGLFYMQVSVLKLIWLQVEVSSARWKEKRKVLLIVIYQRSDVFVIRSVASGTIAVQMLIALPVS